MRRSEPARAVRTGASAVSAVSALGVAIVARGCRALVAAALSFHAAAADSTAPPAETTLADVLRLAREANSRADLERLGAGLADADRRTAAEWPNPNLAFGRERPHGGEATLFDGQYLDDVSLDVPLPAPGLRGARKRAADHALDAARSGALAHVNTLAANAGSAFIELLHSQRDVSVLTTAQSELDRLHAVVAARRATGVASDYDVLRLDVEIATWRSRLDEARTNVLDKQAELATLLGFAGWQPVAVGELPALVEDLRRFEGGEFDLEKHPALVARARSRSPRRPKSRSRSASAGPRSRSTTITTRRSIRSERASALGSRRGADREHPTRRARPCARRGGSSGARAPADGGRARHGSQAQRSRRRATAAAARALRRHGGSALTAAPGHGRSRLPSRQHPDRRALDAARTRYEAQLDQTALQAELVAARLDVAAARGALGAAPSP